MTPAIRLLQHHGIPHRIHSYVHDADHSSYGLEAAEKLGLAPACVFKTLLVVSPAGETNVALVPVSAQLDLKKLAQACEVKKLTMADPRLAERLTGYLVGGISPLGQKRLLPTVLDSSARALPGLFVSGGKRGLEIEMEPDALLQILNARYADIARY